MQQVGADAAMRRKRRVQRNFSIINKQTMKETHENKWALNWTRGRVFLILTVEIKFPGSVPSETRKPFYHP